TSTSHSYSDTGTFQVEVTTLYRGEFSVDGGTWQAIPGQAAVPSEPIEIDVWRTEKELIANE
ncbi:MAG: PKD domain-containing protein, partial [Glutamicibacter arilaitensis]